MTIEELTILCLIQANRLDEALDLLKKYTSTNYEMRSYFLGFIYAGNKEFIKAKEEFDKISSSSIFYKEIGPFAECLNSISNNPLTLIKIGSRQEASDIWEEALKKSPDNLELWHSLAVLYYWQAIDSEVKDKLNEFKLNWHKAIGYWASVLVSDEFWKQYAISRAQSYGIELFDICYIELFNTYICIKAQEKDKVDNYTRAVKKVHKDIKEKFNAHFLQKKQTNSDTYEGLFIEWKLEWTTAYLLKTAGQLKHIIIETNKTPLQPELDHWLSSMLNSTFDLDILLNTIQHELPNNDIKFNPSCGPIMLDFLGLYNDAQCLFNDLLHLTPTNETIKKLFLRYKPKFEKLKFYLHPKLGRWLTIIEAGIYDKAIDQLLTELKSISYSTDSKYYEEIRVLLLKACHDKAKSLYQIQDKAKAYDFHHKAIEALEPAYKYSSGITSSTALDFDIPQIINTICQSISRSFDNGYLDKKEACDLLNRLIRLAPFAGQAVCQKFIDNLNC